MFKKLLGLFALASFFTIPAVSFALPMPTVYNTNMAEKEVSSDTEGGFIRLKGFVCKTSDCSLANADDWYNYRSEPTVEGEETGDGKTLYVSPGDNLTFLAGVTSVTQEGYYPKFSVAFTGDEYITSPDFFGTGQDDLG